MKWRVFYLALCFNAAISLISMSYTKTVTYEKPSLDIFYPDAQKKDTTEVVPLLVKA